MSIEIRVIVEEGRQRWEDMVFANCETTFDKCVTEARKFQEKMRVDDGKEK
jgi:hypothetical protein